MRNHPLSTRPDAEVQQALERYQQAQPVRVSKSAILAAALRRFLLQEGYLTDDEAFEKPQEDEILAAQHDDYLGLAELRASLRK